jgi:hypothetical protein
MPTVFSSCHPPKKFAVGLVIVVAGSPAAAERSTKRNVPSAAPRSCCVGGLTNHDRWFFIQMYRWFPLILTVVTIVRPETLVASGRLSSLLALEIERAGRAPAN